MNETTLTGLIPSLRISLKKTKKKQAKLDLTPNVKPIAFVVKPLASFFNPYKYGCSILCNHPVENEVKPFHSPVKRLRKNGRHGEDKNLDKSLAEKLGRQVEGMLERFKQSPARSTKSPEVKRKCVTPGLSKPRPVLVLDLRRSQSSDNINTPQTGGRATTGLSGEINSSMFSVTPSSASAFQPSKTPLAMQEMKDEEEDDTRKDDNEDVPRRRGKKIKKKKKPLSGQGKGGMGIIEPGETQVSTYVEGGGGGGGGSLEEGASVEEESSEKLVLGIAPPWYTPSTSIFDISTLRHLRRNMTKMDAHSEYRYVWQRVLKEALRASKVSPEEEMRSVSSQLNIPPTDPERWLSLPRIFSYSTSRFQLPLDRSTLNTMSSMEYLRHHVTASKGKQLLYNHVYGKHMNPELPDGKSLTGDKIIEALGDIMGKDLEEEDIETLHEFITWSKTDVLDLLTWYGLCAFTERILGRRFSCSEDFGSRPFIELADFDCLPRLLSNTNPNPKLLHLLKTVDEMGKPEDTSAISKWKRILNMK